MRSQAQVSSSWAFIGLLVVVTAGPACFEPAGRIQTTTRQDSAGVTIVSNAAPGDTERGQWALAARPLLTIGQPDGAPSYLFSSVSHIQLMPDGRLALSDQGSTQLRLYDQDGSFVRSIGRSGEGPGEFTYITSMYVAPDGHLYVHDANLHRVTVFDTTGSTRATHNVPAELIETPASSSVPIPDPEEFLGIVQNQALIFRGRSFIREMRAGPDVTWAYLYQWTPTAEPRRGPAVEILEVVQETGRRVPHYPHFRASANFAVSGRQIAHALGRTSKVDVFDEGLERIMQVRNWIEPIPATGEHQAAYWEWYRRRLPDDPAAVAAYRERFDQTPVVQNLPAIARIMFSTEGCLWVERYASPLTWTSREVEGTIWDVFTGNGEWSGSIELPVDFRMEAAATDRLVGTATDDLGVERVVVYAFEQTGPC